MLLRLLPEQISEQWDKIKDAIMKTFPRSEDKIDMNAVLMDLLNGGMQCWVSCRKEDNVIEGLVTTQVVEDHHGGGKSLLIYSLFGYQMDTKGVWEEGFKTLSIFAKGESCWRITYFTNVNSLIRFAEGRGGNADQRFVSIPI